MRQDALRLVRVLVLCADGLAFVAHRVGRIVRGARIVVRTRLVCLSRGNRGHVRLFAAQIPSTSSVILIVARAPRQVWVAEGGAHAGTALLPAGRYKSSGSVACSSEHSRRTARTTPIAAAQSDAQQVITNAVPTAEFRSPFHCQC